MVGALSACGAASPTPSPSPTGIQLDFARPPVEMDAIECDALLSEAEVEAILNADVTPIGRSASSCHWVGSDRAVQLVFNTSSHADDWRDSLLETYTRRVDAPDLDAWAEPGSESVAAFGPGRGVIVHGVGSEDAALSLLILALSRL